MIDAHHHLWNYDPEVYGWIPDTMAVLRRDFASNDLLTVLADAGVHGTIAVQARTDEAENAFLLDVAATTPAILGVVGWVDLTRSDAGDRLDHWRANRLFKGVREVIQGAPDARFLANPDFHRGIREVTRTGLAYDLLVFADQWPAALAFVDAHPDQRIVLDHAGKPPVEGGNFPDSWAAGIRELARRPNVMAKLSGIVTEVREPGWPWNQSLVQSVVDVMLDSFGPSRLMFGSDWPVCLPATAYADWAAAVRAAIATLSADEQNAILDANARGFYRL